MFAIPGGGKYISKSDPFTHPIIHGGDKYTSKSRCESLRPWIDAPQATAKPVWRAMQWLLSAYHIGRKAQPSLKKANHVSLAAAGGEKPVLYITGFGSLRDIL
jgi:hypothetical protein